MKKKFFVATSILLIAFMITPILGCATRKKANIQTITFPMEKGEQKLSLKVTMPKGWYVSKEKPKEVVYYPSVRKDLYNKKGEFVGYCAILRYDAGIKKFQDVERPEQLYAQVSLANHYQFDVRNSDITDLKYRTVLETKYRRTDVCGVYYSAQLTENEHEKYNYGILSCRNKTRTYVVFDIERNKTTLKQIKKMAKSITY
jgi:hypothetical protein